MTYQYLAVNSWCSDVCRVVTTLLSC